MRVEDCGKYLDTHGVRYRMRLWHRQAHWMPVYILDTFRDGWHLDVHPDTTGRVNLHLRKEAEARGQ